MDQIQSSSTNSSQQRFIEHLEKASEIVGSWPQWKQALLGSPMPVREQRKGDDDQQAPRGEEHGKT
jgi:hypothetical protein